ncbi:efflux RND transporter permease subunit [Leptospira brenneri]|uniref:Efflux RND transporter permease subunit n=1 Tax=Leptospira brenneri TaxID=2023182 RepID=A0A5F1ZBH1_9LEPT|nr:efflux RND transporter permease subunit [Leptospira brenneri]TGK97018.1 efflux RND transporter permease subunit [Leptospira brenneri]
MIDHWIRIHRHRILALILFGVLLSVLSWKGIVFGEEIYLEKKESIQIVTRWPNKTAIQVEESLTKPWEQILKSISGYEQVESISETGNSLILLHLKPEIQKQEIVRSIRNQYLLERQRFPKDSLFPKIQLGKEQENYIVILQKLHKEPDSSRKDLEQKIRNISGVLSFVHHPDKEEEIVLEIQRDRIQNSELPSLSTIFSAIRNHSFGFVLEKGSGKWFQKESPLEFKDWSQVYIPSIFGEGLKFSSIGSVSLQEKGGFRGTRINGLSSETIIISAESSTSLYHISEELKSILLDHKDWILLYNSHEDFMNDLFRSMILFFTLDFVLILFSSFGGKSINDLVVHLFSYYILVFLFFGVLNLLTYPIGRSILMFLILWKYLLFFFPIRRKGPWIGSVCSSLGFFLIMVFGNWIPKSFFVFSLCHLFFLLGHLFLFRLLKLILLNLIPSIRLIHLPWFSYLLKDHSKKQESLVMKKRSILVFFGFLFLGVLFALGSSFHVYPLRPSQGNIQMGKLEFPTSISEGESIRITRQVEESILKQKVTETLVVKQNASSSDFYFRWNELGLKDGIQNLPTESGYFHLLGGLETNSNLKLRFSNANTEEIERVVLGLVPWMYEGTGVKEAVLCFQPSTEGREMVSPSKYRNFLDLKLEDLWRERSLELQSAIVRKVVRDDQLIDVRFSVKQTKDSERDLEKPTKLNTKQSVYSYSFTNYENIKVPGRIYRKNGETSLEILIKGNDVRWEEVKSRIQKFLQKEKVRLTEVMEENAAERNYRPFFLFLIITFFLYRKKDKMVTCIQVLSFFLLWRMNVSIFGGNYLLFGSVATLLLFFNLGVPRRSLLVTNYIPLFLLLLLFYFLPGRGGKSFLEGLVLMICFFLLQSNLLQKWRFFKTKLSF